MSIQATINSTLSLASLLATQSPTLKAKAEKRAELKSLGRREEVLSKAVSESISNPKLGQELVDELGEIKKQQFKVDPSEKSFQAYKEYHYNTTEGQKESATITRADPEEIAEEMYEQAQYENEVASHLKFMLNNSQVATAKAQEAVTVAQEQKRKTRRNFLNYMKDEPTSLGATIGELDPKLQKQILKTYSSAERKKIMDRGDK